MLVRLTVRRVASIATRRQGRNLSLMCACESGIAVLSPTVPVSAYVDGRMTAASSSASDVVSSHVPERHVLTRANSLARREVQQFSRAPIDEKGYDGIVEHLSDEFVHADSYASTTHCPGSCVTHHHNPRHGELIIGLK